MSGISCRFLFVVVSCWQLLTFPVSLYESFPCRFPCRRILPFPRAPLHDLLSSVHPKVVPIFPQCSSQCLYRYNQFHFHFIVLSLSFHLHCHLVRIPNVTLTCASSVRLDCRTRLQRYVKHFPFSKFFRNFLQKKCIFHTFTNS